MLIGLETSKIVEATLELEFGSRVPFQTRGIPVYASSKKQNMVCLSSGEFELMALVGGACEGIATRDQWNKMCKGPLGTIVLCTNSPAALGFVKRKGASRRNRHVDTKVYPVRASMKPGQRILKVPGDTPQVADCLTKVMTLSSSSSQSPGTLTDAAFCRDIGRWGAEDRCPPNHCI